MIKKLHYLVKVVRGNERTKVSFIILGLITLVLIALLIHFILFVGFASKIVRFPFGLDYGEGVVWQQAILIPGKRMYGDINQFPFIVFHYPPVYHFILHAAYKFNLDLLLFGRCVSLLSSMISGILIGAITFSILCARAEFSVRFVGAAAASLSFFCFYPVVVWSPLMRVDMLAIALSYCGIWLISGTTKQRWRFYLAAIMFLASAFTKQTCITAPLTGLLVVVLINAVLFRAIICFVIGLFAAAFCLLELVTRGGFLDHIIFYNIHRYSFQAAAFTILLQITLHLSFFTLSIVGCLLRWRQLMADRAWDTFNAFRSDLICSDRVRSMTVLTLYCCLLALSSFSLGKSGAAINYLIEWMGALSIFVGVVVALMVEKELLNLRDGGPRSNSALALLLPFTLFIQTVAIPVSRDRNFVDHSRTRELNDLVSRIRNSDTPVISDDIVLLMKAGKEVSWESATFAELATTGRWDESRILDMLNARKFAFVITEGQKGDVTFDSRYTPAVALAIEGAYPRIEMIAGLTVRSPE